MLGSGHDGVTQCSLQTQYRLLTACLYRHNPALAQAQLIVACQRRPDLRLPGDNFIYSQPPAGISVQNASLSHDTFREAVLAESQHLLIQALREIIRIAARPHAADQL